MNAIAPEGHPDSLLKDFYASVNWLHSFITDQAGARYFQEKDPEVLQQELRAGLARTADFLTFAGNPQAQFSSVHVAGTSGKGSVVTMLANILACVPFRVGYHLSPYLQICTEKIVLNGRRISPPDFVDLVRQFRSLHQVWTNTPHPSGEMRYPEVWTALTFLYFAHCPLDWAVIETGVGGRFDPSNVLPSKLAVITEIALDHTKLLGPTLGDIAYHKAGIIKPAGLVVTAATWPETLPVLEAEAAVKQARLYVLGRDFHFALQEATPQGTVLSIQTPFHHYKNLYLNLRGTFQSRNAALAVTAAELLAQAYNFSLSPDVVQEALRQVTFPGRLEVMQTAPLVLVDGAHNPHEVQSLVSSLKALYPEKKIIAILGMLLNRDAEAMLQSCLPVIQHLILTQPHVLGKPAVESIELAAISSRLVPRLRVDVVEHVQAAIDLALHQASEDTLVLVTGSLYLVGEARSYWIAPERLLQDDLEVSLSTVTASV